MQSIFGDSEPAMQPSNPVPDPTSIMLLPRTSSGLLQSTCATAQSTGAGGRHQFSQTQETSGQRRKWTGMQMDKDARRQIDVCEHKSRLILFFQRMWYPRTNDGAVPHDHARVNRVRICYIVPSARLGKCAGEKRFERCTVSTAWDIFRFVWRCENPGQPCRARIHNERQTHTILSNGDYFAAGDPEAQRPCESNMIVPLRRQKWIRHRILGSSFTTAHRHPLFTSCPNCTNPNGPNDVFDPPVSTSPSMTAGKGTRGIAPWPRFSPKVSIRLEWNCLAPSRARRGPRPTFLGSSSRTRWTDSARRNTARSRERQGGTAVGKSMHQCRVCGIPCIPRAHPRRPRSVCGTGQNLVKTSESAFLGDGYFSTKKWPAQGCGTWG